jgi:putative Holliday junction resolvase
MGRILAIDYGRKRVGIAVTDPLNIIASPLITVPAAEIENFLAEYLKKEEVDEFVVGYPVTLNNKASEAVRYVNPFIRRLEKLFPEKKINLADERFTSSMAKQTIIDGGVKKMDRQDKSLADKISASLILRSFLERREYERNKS